MDWIGLMWKNEETTTLAMESQYAWTKNDEAVWKQKGKPTMITKLKFKKRKKKIVGFFLMVNIESAKKKHTHTGLDNFIHSGKRSFNTTSVWWGKKEAKEH